MKAALLKTTDLTEVPSNLTVLENWGEVLVYVEDDDRYITGNHIMIEGDEEAVLAWLRSSPWVWMQKPGTPAMLQQFEQWHF